MKNDNFINIVAFGLKSLVGGIFVAGGVCLSLFTPLSSFVPVTFYVIAGSFFADGVKSVVKYVKNKKQEKSYNKKYIEEDYEIEEESFKNEHESANYLSKTNNSVLQNQEVKENETKDTAENDTEIDL